MFSVRALRPVTGSLSMRLLPFRTFATDFSLMRNIGISAHIDSGKTTLTERILYYTGRINEIHEVRGKDGVGAKMDSMDLEREKGITIASAATFTKWKDTHINIIDTPGHVDFTIEVERALRVLDGAVLVLCGVSGVQSQTMTVDRQMKRYNVPRITFINKLDRMGSRPKKVVEDLREKLRLNAALVQTTVGLEDNLRGVIDIVAKRVIMYDVDHHNPTVSDDIPAEFAEEVAELRATLLEQLSEVDDEMAEMFLMEEEPTTEQLKAAIRRATLNLSFVPVFLGSAYKNRGVQTMLDGVLDYLPDPTEIDNRALDLDNDEAEIKLETAEDKPTVALAFKLQESRFGQLTYMRVYQGNVSRGQMIVNSTTGKKMKVPRLIRMHSDEMEDVDSVGPGEIVAMFGVDCASGDTFTDSKVNYSMTSMFVPEAVMSVSVEPKKKGDANFAKAVQRFCREDPTFKVHFDDETSQTIASGMGELHLDIYMERMRREYDCDVSVGEPQVKYREAITKKALFDYTHKKQSGGAGQYGKVQGFIEPLDPDDVDEGVEFLFDNHITGNAIPPEFLPAIKRGFQDACDKGSLVGHPIKGVRVVITDGAAHAVDSSEMAFKTAARDALRSVYQAAGPQVLEPLMKVDVEAPMEFQGNVIGNLTRRNGTVLASDTMDNFTTVAAEVPLAKMFGYSTDLRSSTQGKGEFTMEFSRLAPVTKSEQEELVKAFIKKKAEERK